MEIASVGVSDAGTRRSPEAPPAVARVTYYRAFRFASPGVPPETAERIGLDDIPPSVARAASFGEQLAAIHHLMVSGEMPIADYVELRAKLCAR